MSDTSYIFKEVTDVRLFDTFVRSNGGTVFQTLAWAKVKTAWKPRGFMGFKDDRPVISILCLERKIKFFGNFWYGAEGFAGDVSNKELIHGLVVFLKKEMAKHGVFGMAIDPYYPVNINGTDIDDERIGILSSAGFKIPSDRNVYSVQPPTDVVVTVWDKDEDELLSSCEKGVRHGYRTGLENGLYAETVSGRDIKQSPEMLDTFFSVMTETADRVEFVHRTKEYYANILESLGMDAELMLVWYDRDKETEKYNSSTERAGEIEEQIVSFDLSEKGAKQKIALLKKELSSLQKYIQTYKKIEAELESADNASRKICLAAGLTSYFGRESVCLYGGTVNLLRNTLRPTHFLNFSRIIESSRRGCSSHSMGRITGDPFDPNNPLYGLVNYKKSYGGDVYVYVGDMRLARGTGLKMYLFTNLFPKIRHFRSTVLRNILNRKNLPSKGESR